MAKRPALLFLPDISGFTEFVQSTELEHSQHIIAELLEILIEANTIDLKLAEVEGDALFFYREDLPSASEFYAQVLSMFKAFHEHLEMLKTHRICPCNACTTAPRLQLKIIAHAGPVEFIKVQQSSKPFGPHVIEVHRLMKNSVTSDSYLLVSDTLHDAINLGKVRHDNFAFRQQHGTYDGKQIDYHFALVNVDDIDLAKPTPIRPVKMDGAPDIVLKRDFPVSRDRLFEYVANYRYRHLWNYGVDSFNFSEHEVTRLGSEHACVINNKSLDFTAITKDGQEGQLVYGELSENPPAFLDELYQFMTIQAISKHESSLLFEMYLIAKSPIKRALISLLGKKLFRKNVLRSVDELHRLVSAHSITTTPVKIVQ